MLHLSLVNFQFLHRRKILSLNDPNIIWSQFLFHPSDFGGINLSSYQSHFVRSFDDKVCLWLGIMLTAQRTHPELFKRIISINFFERKLGEPNIRNLIEDIFSLNVVNLPSIETSF